MNFPILFLFFLVEIKISSNFFIQKKLHHSFNKYKNRDAYKKSQLKNTDKNSTLVEEVDVVKMQNTMAERIIKVHSDSNTNGSSKNKIPSYKKHKLIFNKKVKKQSDQKSKWNDEKHHESSFFVPSHFKLRKAGNRAPVSRHISHEISDSEIDSLKRQNPPTTTTQTSNALQQANAVTTTAPATQAQPQAPGSPNFAPPEITTTTTIPPPQSGQAQAPAETFTTASAQPITTTTVSTLSSAPQGSQEDSSAETTESQTTETTTAPSPTFQVLITSNGSSPPQVQANSAAIDTNTNLDTTALSTVAPLQSAPYNPQTTNSPTGDQNIQPGNPLQNPSETVLNTTPAMLQSNPVVEDGVENPPDNGEPQNFPNPTQPQTNPNMYPDTQNAPENEDSQNIQEETPLSVTPSMIPAVPVAPQVNEPVTPQVNQPVTPQINQPVTPQINQPVAPPVNEEQPLLQPNQVSESTNFANQCPVEVESLGCFVKTNIINQLIPMSQPFQSLEQLFCECGNEVASQGWSFFSLENGNCYASSETVNVNTLVISDTCVNNQENTCTDNDTYCQGRGNSMAVYYIIKP